ncbi:MAG: acyltransferase [Methylobacterium sp.]|nr:MAG: acyltransferase [Methylobacterium sp.]
MIDAVMRRLHCIDSIRGLAALAVIYAHTVEFGLRAQLGPSPLERDLLGHLTAYLDVGKIAVTLFFAVSGFVVPFSLFKPSRRPVLAFAVSRFFRLYPAYWLSIPCGLLVLFVWAGRDVPNLLVPANMTMLQQFLGVENIIGLYWTLQIELIFYAICVGLFVIGRLDDRTGAVVCALSLIAAAVVLAGLRFHLERKFPVAVPLSLAVMFWGLCLRYHVFEQRAGWGSASALVTAALILAVPLVSVLAYNRDMGFHESWVKYVITYWLAMALFALLGVKVRIEGRVFVGLGAISYSIYLFGPVVQVVLEHALAGYEPVVPVHVFAAATALVTVGVATLMYRWIERPAIALGRHVVHRFGDRPRLGESAAAVAAAPNPRLAG